MQLPKDTYKLVIKVFLVAAVLAAGFYVRTERVFEWNANKELYFANGEPSFLDLDGCYYLQTAKEILKGTYTPIDTKRAYPETATRPQHPSLLSYSLAYFSKLSGLSLNWTAVFFPVVLGLCIAFPLYFFSSFYGSFTTVIGSLTIGLLSHYYSSRTTLGRIDTDCLVVFFPLACAYFFMRFGTETAKKRYAYFSVGTLFYLLFLWWWDMSPTAVSVLSLSPLLVALIFHYHPKGNEGVKFYAVLSLAVCAGCYVIGYDGIVKIFQSILGQFSYISKQEAGLFPNIGLSIEEQGTFSFSTIADTAITGMVSLVFAVCGLVLLAKKKRTLSFYLLPLLVIGCFGVFFAERFLIFLTPVLAIGFGYFFSEALATTKNKILATFLYVLFLGYITSTTLLTQRGNSTFFSGQIVQGMMELDKVTPKNAVIWSWWDEGHPLIYWADRATISDGWMHGGMLTYCTALPLAANDYRLAANFMQFYVVRGQQGINQFTAAAGPDFETGMQLLKTVLSNGPEVVDNSLQLGKFDSNFFEKHGLSAREFFFPPHAPPVFIFLDIHLLRIQRWIHWYGSWNTDKKSGSQTLPTIIINDVKFDQEGFPDDPRFSFNEQNGTLELNGTFEQPASMSGVRIIKGSEQRTIEYAELPKYQNSYAFSVRMKDVILANQMFSDKGRYFADFIPQHNQIAIRDEQTSDALINHLFYQKNDSSSKYFEAIDVSETAFQIWRVRGEQ